MADLFFGVKIGLFEESEMRYIIDLLHMHTVKLGVYEQWPALNITGLGTIVSWLLRTCSPTTQRFNAWHKECMDKAVSTNVKDSHGVLAPVVQGAFDGKESTHTSAQMYAEGFFTTFTSKPSNTAIHWPITTVY